MKRGFRDNLTVAIVAGIALLGWLRPQARAGGSCDVPAKYYYVAFNGHVVRTTPVSLGWIEDALNGPAPPYYKTVILGGPQQFRTGAQFIKFVTAVQEDLIHSSPWLP